MILQSLETPGRRNRVKQQPELVRVAASPKFMLNGVAVSPRGRVFASIPRWTSLAAPSVMEAMPDGSFEPYPGDAWNEWRPEAAARDSIVSSHAVFADSRNNLWVVDDAAPRVAPPVEGAAKLVKFDLDTDRVSRVYPLGVELLPKGAMIGHVRVDARFAYVTEAHHGSIIVVDLESGRARKLLEHDKSTRASPSIVPVVEGRELRRKTGEVPLLHVDLLELSEDGRWLYFMPLFGPVLRRIETKVLQDETLSEAEVAACVDDVVRVPPLVPERARGRAGRLALFPRFAGPPASHVQRRRVAGSAAVRSIQAQDIVSRAFVRPPSSEEAMRDLEDLAAPVKQRECPVALRMRRFGLESARPLSMKGGGK